MSFFTLNTTNRANSVLFIFIFTMLIFISTQAAEEEIPDIHRKIEPTFQNILGFVLVSIFVIISSGGGIGGGGILVPTYIFVFNFSPKVAIPLASTTILGSSIANCILIWRKKHPINDERPLIDWNILIIMEPLTVLGAVIGSYLNILLPSYVIIVLLTVLLAVTTVKTLHKAHQLYVRENNDTATHETIDNKCVAGNDNDNEEGSDSSNELYDDQCPSTTNTNDVQNIINMPVLLPSLSIQNSEEIDKNTSKDIIANIPSKTTENKEEAQTTSNDLSLKLSEIYSGERSHPKWKISLIVVLTTCVSFISIMKGGETVNPLGIKCGSIYYWTLLSCIIPIVFIISLIARRYLIKIFYYKKELLEYGMFRYTRGDVRWSHRNTVVYPLICSIAGLCAGMFGIGGGIVKGPLMLEMKVLPSVASATSATMILFTSSAAIMEYSIFGALNINYAPFLFVTGFVNALIGRTTLNYFVDKYKRQSLIAIIIGFTVGASTIAMATAAVIDIVINGASDTETSIC